MTRWLAPAIDTLPGARCNLSNYPFCGDFSNSAIEFSAPYAQLYSGVETLPPIMNLRSLRNVSLVPQGTLTSSIVT